MAQPRGRRGSGRGRGSSRPAQRGQSYSGRPARGRQNGGYGGNAGPSSQLPLFLGLGGAAVVLVVVLVLVLSSGGDEPRGGTVVAGNGDTGGNPGTSNRRTDPEPGAPDLADVPLTRDEVKEITERIDGIARKYDFSRARQLVRDGLEAMNSGDNSRAHECWNEADRILHPMVEQANRVFEDYGELDGVERVIKWARSAKAKADEWESQRALYLKFLRKD